jgi:putative transposase
MKWSSKKSDWQAAHQALGGPRAEWAFGVNVRAVCARLGMSRQNYYSRRKERQRREVAGDLVAGLVQRERQWQPRLGTRKLHHLLKRELKEAGLSLGRDRLFEELRRRDLLVEPVPAPYPRTTQSYHNLPIFQNLVKGRELRGPNEVWVSDLTYLRTLEGALYLALITDKYSRKIVGYHVGDTLEAMGCVRALEWALKELPKGSKPIHHSDQGSQYCCHEYVNRLLKNELTISMTERDHCAENALAERMNGILKQEYGLGVQFTTKEDARLAVEQGVWLYNTKRPHTALAYQVPEQVHRFGRN